MASLDRIRAKWDALAAPQLRAELDRMSAALEAAEARAERAEAEAGMWMQTADDWRDDALAAIEAEGKHVGITKEGRLVSV